jgi:hypothetical protein
MNAEALDFNLQAELRNQFANAKDEESVEAHLALQTLDESLAVADPYCRKILVND